ncbi:hypothetical protein [Nocardia gamkensis]|uniref:hypothetical protein n=1 Tax=Nocardia gamkensis TaxID=352869 RepID=UPI0037B0FD48
MLSGRHDISGGFGPALTWIRNRANDFRRDFASTGTPDSVHTCDLITLPYPTRFGLFRAAATLAPFLWIRNRMLVIRWHDTDGRRRTLLFEPSDHILGRNTPYFADLAAKLPNRLTVAMLPVHGTVEDHLQRLSITPDDVDFLMFDHLHTQDLRRWVGTTAPQPGFGDTAIEPYFPNAKVIVQREELTAMAALHPLQVPWYQADTFTDLRPDAFAAIDGDVLLGPGVAVLKTPGHVFGNQSLVLNTSTGIWASSENAIAVEAIVPEHSSIPGLRRWSQRWSQEVVLNANTIETTAAQYNSLVLEKSIVDRSTRDSRFPQFFPSSELVAHWTSPGTTPTFSHHAIEH